jgi:hypothetical protein
MTDFNQVRAFLASIPFSNTPEWETFKETCKGIPFGVVLRVLREGSAQEKYGAVQALKQFGCEAWGKDNEFGGMDYYVKYPHGERVKVCSSTPRVLDLPRDWMHRLRDGHFVWLPKERQHAQVIFRWERPEPGTVAGKIAIRRIVNGNPFDGGHVFGNVEVWYVRPDGTGFDGNKLIQPLAGYLLKDVPYEEDRIQKLERDVAALKRICLKYFTEDATIPDVGQRAILRRYIMGAFERQLNGQEPGTPK